MKTKQAVIKAASFGSVSEGTLKTADLLSAFISELEWQVSRNGEFFGRPENFELRDKLANLVGEAQDCFAESGDEIDENKQDEADGVCNDMADVLSDWFAPAYGYFGAHAGDGADFGFWPQDIEEIKEQVEFASSVESEFPTGEFSGEWLHINERGNCTLYVRENGRDVEIWSLV